MCQACQRVDTEDRYLLWLNMKNCTSKAHPGGKGDRYAGTVEIIRLSPSALSAPQYSGALSPLRATRVYLLTRTLCEIAPLNYLERQIAS